MTNDPLKIGLMGFGRMGRNLLRILHDAPDLRIPAPRSMIAACQVAWVSG